MNQEFQNGGDPETGTAASKHAIAPLVCNGRPHPLSWEVLPPEEHRVAQSVMMHPKTQQILTAFIGGATKTEIARVFGLKEKLVRSVIAAAQQLGNHQ